MKKMIKVPLVALLMFLMSFSGICGEADEEGSVLPVPEYPLTEETIDAAVKATGLSWDARVAEHADIVENQTMYELYAEDGKMIASVSSYGDEEGRFLMLGFMSPVVEGELAAIIEEEYWDEAMTLVAMLYGGLESESQIYDTYRSEFEMNSVVLEEDGDSPNYNEKRKWERDFGDISCLIRTLKVKIKAPQEYLQTIKLYNNDKFI